MGCRRAAIARDEYRYVRGCPVVSLRTREGATLVRGLSGARVAPAIIRRAFERGPVVGRPPLFSRVWRRSAMGYLDPTEYVTYGLTAETTDDWVTMASSLIEAHCRRQSLLVTQYVERMRLTAGSQAVRLSYLPLTPLGTAASPLGGVGVR